MNIYYSVFAIISGFALSEVSGLRCWTCDNQPSNAGCTANGMLRTCLANEKSCQNEVRVMDRGILITKRCKQVTACQNNFVQNDRPAWMPSQCNINTISSVCRCCCDTDGCNEDLQCGGRRQEPQKQVRPAQSCQALQRPSNGRMICSTRNGIARRGDTCTFSCLSGYQLSGHRTRKCMLFRRGPMRFGGKHVTCTPIPKCEIRTAPDNGGMSCTNSNSIRRSCEFTCNDGYVLLGNHVSVCGSDGTWSHTYPSCVRISCLPKQINPRNGDVTCTDSNNVESECGYACNDGHDLIGSADSICLSNRDGTALGSWSNSAPLCQPKTCVPPLSAPENGEISCNGNSFASNCTFQCNSGYTLIGASSSTCLLVSDESVSWSSGAPICEFIERAPERLRSPPSCSIDLVAPVNGQISCSNGNDYKSECVFSCEDGFSLEGVEIRVCDGELTSLEWTAETPTCEEIVCPSQTIAKNGNVECTLDSNYSSICSFQCKEGFSLYPANVTENTCQVDSTWNYPAPCCARMCPPFSFMDAVIILDSSRSIGRDNWKSMKQFIRGIIDLFEISPDSSRIAVFRYNRKVDNRTQIFLDSYPDNKTALLNKYDDIPYNGGGTNTGKALRHARNVSFKSGNRPEAKDVLIVVTDGRSQDDVHEISEQLRSDGVLTYAIGIGSGNRGPDREQLMSIGGETDHYFLVESGFQGLNERFSDQLEKEICSVNPCNS